MDRNRNPACHPAAVLGLGRMGRRIAVALGGDGEPVFGYDPSTVASDAAASAGVHVCPDACTAIADAAFVMLALPGPAAVLDVLHELADDLHDKLVIDTSTIDPASARAAGRLVSAAGGRYVDAPVLGRPERCGAWTLAVGGAAADVEGAATVTVGRIAQRVEHVGPVGAGSALKVLNNVMFAAINAITAEVVDLAERAGIPAQRFASVVAESGAATVSNLFRDIAPRMARHDYHPAFTLGLLLKDVHLGRDLATDLGCAAPVTDVVEQVTARAVEAGRSAQDTSALVEIYRATHK